MTEERDWSGIHMRMVEIPIHVERSDDGIWVATSPMIKGLLVVAKDGSQIYGRIYEAVKDLASTHVRLREALERQRKS